ncbi:hypothetical protein J5N97_020565 [Dioscorea zingiberensis]|uniref:Peptidase M28 domain-containing protein n=1 Tax=Dioscorea zingiberensis TaxID=325984 RepID=A0A9D5CG32_9LILI|nr:hypothetical protein J5N97_020565 [Dioscorea zingiberensis]
MRLLPSAADLPAFACLLFLAATCAVLSQLAYDSVRLRNVRPRGADAPLDCFSEARALEHVRRLTVDIDGRQEGKPGLEEAARYIRGQLDSIAARAAPDIRVEVEETLVNGSFNMRYLDHSISVGYRNHTNILMRISSKNSTDSDPSVLVNGHFDAPLGSPGAGDCGSCVASMLEMARLLVDACWLPPRPIIFLFNGAEELYLLGSHGFIKTHRWKNSIGAFINIEASGTGGLDLVCRSGPGSWPSFIYAQSAVHPMAISAAEDVFGIIPGDTDYRIFAEDYGNIPGLDIIFVLGGYFYHTSYDTIERIFPGSIQARGENLFHLIAAFASSPMLLNAEERSLKSAEGTIEERAVYFDYMSWFLIFYSRRFALVLHCLPILIFLLMPLFICHPNISVASWFLALSDLLKGLLLYAIGIFLAIIIPVVFTVIKLLIAGYPMSWFAHPYLAVLMFVPSSFVGLLFPGIFFGISQHVPNRQSKETLSEQTYFWGAFGFYGLITMACLIVGLSGGFLTFLISTSMIFSWLCFRLTIKYFSHKAFWSLTGYVIPSLPCLAYFLYFGGFLVQFVIEKMGMMGSLPQPYGYFIPDIIVAVVIGMVTCLCAGPLIPVLSQCLARSSIIHFLVHLTILGLALSSQFFPYSKDAPKRVVLQQTFLITGDGQILDSSYDFSVVDANSLSFLFKYAPQAAKFLSIDSEIPFEMAKHSDRNSWLAAYPLSFLFYGSLKFPAPANDIILHYKDFPHLWRYDTDSSPQTEFRKIYLKLYLGSLEEISVAVLNITGPLSNWSFADNRLPEPETSSGTPPSYICRLSGTSHENWTFWLEANTSEALRVEVAVLDQYLVDDAKKLKSLFPRWVDVTAFSTFFSVYNF